MKYTADDILNFWFNESTKAERWQKDAKYDQKIYDRFNQLYRQAAAGELYAWRETVAGAGRNNSIRSISTQYVS